MHLRLALAAVLTATSLHAQIQRFSAHLDGFQEVPPVMTGAEGWAVVRLDTSTNTVRVFAHASGLTAVAAHVHLAPSGSNGGVILPLAGGPTTWTASGSLTAPQVSALQAGDTYVNLHTAAHPGGEIRGQIEPAVVTRFTAVLDGSQVVPPTGSSATGTMTAFLHEPDRVLVYEMDVTGLNPTAAHIHRGSRGVSGGVAYPLNGSGTRWCGVTVPFSANDHRSLFAGDLYVNVHSSAFPGGEIRGQLLRDDADFRASLDGAQQNPPVRTLARGEACVTLNPDRTVTYDVVTAGLTAVAAHFHVGARGVNGPVVFALSGGPTTWQGTTPVLSAAQVADVRAARWYVNVHTSANPGGEIRGQVELAALPTTYGGGCPLAGAATPEIGSSGVACLGSSFDITLFGGSAARPCVVLFGASRDVNGGVPLPLSLAFLGATDCFLLHDNIGLSIASVTDALGCAKASLPIPFVPGVRATFHAQWFVLDPAANPFGLASSNGLSFDTR